jgi:hypothetical protein
MKRIEEDGNHPASISFALLIETADRLGIRLSVTRGRMTLSYQGAEYEVLDVQDSEWPMSEFPPPLEYCLAVVSE